MKKTILITGSTDGIGLVTARAFAEKGHTVILHGRNEAKLAQAKRELGMITGSENIEGYLADMSDLVAVARFAESFLDRHRALDVLINNAGVYKTAQPVTATGFDVRFVVNTIAPYLLTKKLLPLMSASGRVINLSSAAQSPVDLKALSGQTTITNDFDAYGQSKLAITIWSKSMAQSIGNDGPAVIAVNPGSLLATKMVKEGFGTAGHDITIGSDILTRLSLEDEFATASGRYFDNDRRQFASPHPSGLDQQHTEALVAAVESLIAEYL